MLRLTFIAKNEQDEEMSRRFEVENSIQNPAIKYVEEGKRIGMREVFDMIGETDKAETDLSAKEIARFCLEALIMRHYDIRYYWR